MQHNKQRKNRQQTEVKRARQSKTKMAHTTLVGMFWEYGAAKSMAAVMKDIVAAMNAPEDTRRKLREQIDDACSSKKATESSKNADEFKFKEPRHTLEGWKELLRAKRKEPMKDVHFKT